ncbi:TonB-dependent receptor [Terriglobus roseus]|uniref:TonB-dependent receptor n=1 Tax=Terriglobus roseus TaxID=392734 RepID=UPI0012F632C1|nr:TonB-dependent receptor [Terriglobus roseus]
MAQIANGSVTGQLTDSAGAVVPNAEVSITKTETGITQQTRANGDGIYIFPALQTGTYKLTAILPGFKKSESTVTLAVGQTAQLNIALEIGSSAESVTVQASSAEQLNTDNSTLSYTVGARQVSELPLNGRNPYALAQLSPGINPGGSFGTGVSTTRGALVAAATNNFSSNGGVSGNNEILIDGISVTLCCQGQPALTPSAEVVDQFKVITSNPGAQFGRSSGGFLNIVTKTGTNRLHGTLYDFLRNDKLDAANYFQKRSGVYPIASRKDFRYPHRYNQYGGFVSGPVFIPKLYPHTDKTFFTFGYEGQRNVTYAAQTLTVPTALMRKGIFTENTGNLVYDPYSTTQVGNNYVRTPLPAGCNASGCFGAGQGVTTLNPLAAKLIALYPLPNQPGLTNNYTIAQPTSDKDDQFNFRIDHNFSASNRAFMRGTRGTNVHNENDLFTGAYSGTNSIHQQISGSLFALSDSWTISPTMLLQITYGFAAQRNVQLPGNFTIPASEFGFSANYQSEQQTTGTPVVALNGFQQIGTAANSNQWNHYTHTLVPFLVWQLGKHSMTIGYEGRLVNEMEQGFGNPLGNMTFDSTLTRGANAANGVSGIPAQFATVAAMLLGTPTTAAIQRQSTLALQQWYHAIYVQDDWRIRNNLTLNLGLRYDRDQGFTDRHNAWAALDLQAANPLSSAALPFTGGAQYVGVNGNPRNFWNNYNKFGPRVGFAYNPNPSTVVRGGYDLLYLPSTQRIYSGGTLGFSQTTQQTYTYTQRPTTLIDNPLPGGVLLPAGSAAGVQVGAGTSVSGLLYKNPLPYYSQWNFGVEQQISSHVVLHLNYAGSKGTHLPIGYRPNDLQPRYWGAVGDPGNVQSAYLTAQVANPLYGQPGVSGNLASPTVQRQQLLAAYPQYGPNTGLTNGSLNVGQYNIASSTYHAFQAFMTMKTSNLSAIVSYTWSKLLGNTVDVTTGAFNANGTPGVQNFYRYDLERSVQPTDIPHRVVGNLNYTLPFGRGQRFGGNLPGWANQAVGGWKLNFIGYIQSGYALGVTQTGGAAYSGSRPSFVPGVSPLTAGGVRQRLGGGSAVGQTQGYFNPAGFRLAQAFELGNVPRVSGQLRGPFGFQDDISAIKEFPIHDTIALQFRLEAFNFMNKVWFGLPNQQFNSATFGQITQQYNLPRNVQVALKLNF